MRILQLIRSAHPAGGGPREHLLRSSELLARKGHEVVCATLDRFDAPWLVGHGIRMIGLGRTEHGFGFSSGAFKKFCPLLQECDVLLVRGLWQFHIIVAAAVLRKIRRPYFVFAHGMLDPWFSYGSPMKHFKKMVFWRLVQHRFLQNAEALLFTTDEERVLARGVFHPWGLRERVISYGTLPPADEQASAQRHAFVQKYPKLGRRKFLLFLGRLHVKKGCESLIEAFGAFNCESCEDLVFAGSGDAAYVEKLRARASQMSCAHRIHFIGLLEGPEKWGALRSAEAFVLPSYQENFGIAVVEALACGVPVLISNRVNTHREIVADEAGFVDDPTTEGVLRLLRRFCALSAQEKSVMGAKATECFSKRYNLQKNIDELEALLRGKCA